MRTGNLKGRSPQTRNLFPDGLAVNRVSFRQALLFPENLVQRNLPKHQWKREPRLIERPVYGRQFGNPTDRSWPEADGRKTAIYRPFWGKRIAKSRSATPLLPGQDKLTLSRPMSGVSWL